MNSFFNQMNDDLRAHGLGQPMLLIDDDALNFNIAYVKQQLASAKHLKPRLVVKSLACLPLLKKLSFDLDTQHFMVFHIDHLQLMFNHFDQADLLFGKPMPIRAVERFYQNHHTPIKCKIHWLIDSFARLQQYHALADQLGFSFNINLEIDVGLHRGGVQNSAEFIQMLNYIQQHQKTLNLSGLMGYDAHVTKLPKMVKRPETAYAESQHIYQNYQHILKHQFPDLNHAQLCFNGGGSPTFSFHVKHSVCNDLSFGSMLLKPSDFDSEHLSLLKPALYIASPVLKVLDEVSLPGIPSFKKIKFFQKHQAVFIYGGYWMGQYVYPAKSHPHLLYGRSTNQEMICVDRKIDIHPDDYVFIRPSQSEVVIPQFNRTYLYRKENEWNSSDLETSRFEPWENFRE